MAKDGAKDGERMPNLRGLEAFATLGETGSLRGAATRLNLTPSAVSRRIAALEHDLGLRLLKRSPQGVEFTDDGRTLHQGAVRAFRALARQAAELKGRRRRIVIKSPQFFASTWLADNLARLQARYPAIDFSVQTAFGAAALGENEIGFRFGLGDWNDADVALLLRVPMMAVAGPAWAGHETLTRADLARGGIVLVRGTEPVWQRLLTANRLGRLDGLRVTAFDNNEVVMRAARAGAGFAITGERTRLPPGLVRFPSTLREIGAGIFLVTPPDGVSGLPLRDLVRWLKAELKLRARP
jgi:LysR family glycine cleavage system transcriptional activator